VQPPIQDPVGAAGECECPESEESTHASAKQIVCLTPLKVPHGPEKQRQQVPPSCLQPRRLCRGLRARLWNALHYATKLGLNLFLCPRRVKTAALSPTMLSAALAGGIRGAARPPGGLGNSPVGEDAVSTVQKFLNSVLNVPRSGVLLFVHTIADVPVDGVPVVRGVRVGNDRRRAFDKRISPTSAQQLKQAETAAGEVDRSENQRAGRARPNRHHTTLAFIAPVAEDGVGRVATL
jgi:hypothetical protein